MDVILSREANTVGSRLKNCATTALAPVRILGAYIRQGFAVMRNKGGRISMSSFCTVSKIPKMFMFTLAVFCLTMSNIPWFMNLTF